MIHTFLRSIGFKDIHDNRDLYRVLEDVVNNSDTHRMGLDQYNNEFASFSKDYGEEFGITVCGNFINEDEFRMEYYYPYFIGSAISTNEPVEIEQHASKLSFAGICDELKLGVALIFYVNNEVDVLKRRYSVPHDAGITNVVLSALGASGKILLPVRKSKKNTKDRSQLLQMAREGDTTAIEHLTIKDMDTYSSLYRRVRQEDVLTIVESSFIPYGIESDQYIVIGEITGCYKDRNSVTNEALWVLNLVCNHLSFDVIINEKDLMGEPEIGRRFRGRVWMQGHLNFGY